MMSFQRIVFIFLVLSFVSQQSVAQVGLSTKNKKAIELYMSADNYRVRGQYKQAIDLLNQAIDKDKEFVEAYLSLGIIYKSQKDLAKSTSNFEKGLELTTDPKKQKPYYFELADNNLRAGKYQEGLTYVNKYLEAEQLNKVRIELANMWKRNAEYAIQNQKITSQYKPRPLSDTVNHFVMQYFPVLTADEQEMIYTRRLGERNQDDEDLAIVKKLPNGNWSMPASISGNINSEFNEGTSTISADGRSLIFTSCIGRKGYGSCDLFESHKVGNEWSVPVNMGPTINSTAWESQPSLSADGRTIYFVSDRKGGQGDRDIYVSYKLDDNKWTKAENLGKPINSPFEEISPFIHVNGRTLFFSTNGRTGFGGLDIYKTERENGVWAEPVNFGSPINDHEDQFSLFITADGKTGYYSHEDQLKQNSSKIYTMTIPEELQIKFRSNVVKGIVRDKGTKTPLKAKIELYDLQKNESVSTVLSDSITGDYLIVLTQGSDYGLYVSAKNYLFQSLNFNYEKENNLKPVEIDVYLDKASAGAMAVLNNIFFEFDKFDLKDTSIPELNKVVKFLQENPDLKVEVSGHTDNSGTVSYNQQLSLKRAQSVSKYLVAQGIDQKRITQKGFGSEKPVKPNDSEENKQINRRIEFKILP